MIISASRRTDIPAFYGEWFRIRLEEGFVDTINPYNSKNVKRIGLKPEEVSVFVFWTKNPIPFEKQLDYLDEAGYNYYFQYTLNAYPKIFEPGLPEIENRLEAFYRLSERLGSQRVIWRYDPIIVSSLTGVEFHLEWLWRLADKLDGRFERLVVSFYDFYPGLQKRIRNFKAVNGIEIIDILAEKDIHFLERLCNGISTIFSDRRVEVQACCEPLDLSAYGIRHGSCIDGDLINRLTGNEVAYKKDRNQRVTCGCVKAIDIGIYDTCPAGCIYCYACRSKKMLEANISRHIQNGTSLI